MSKETEKQKNIIKKSGDNYIGYIINIEDETEKPDLDFSPQKPNKDFRPLPDLDSKPQKPNKDE